MRRKDPHPVNSAWGSAVPGQGKGPNQGWRVPLWNPAAAAESVIQTVDGKLKLLTAEGESVSGAQCSRLRTRTAATAFP
jgi:hypothetical protein